MILFELFLSSKLLLPYLTEEAPALPPSYVSKIQNILDKQLSLLNWPFRNCAGNWGEFQFVTIR